MKSKLTINLLVSAGMLIAAGISDAVTIVGDTIIDPNLQGATSTNLWDHVAGRAGFGSFPGSGAWPAAGMAPNLAPAVNPAALMRISGANGGGPYSGNGSIYYGGFVATVNSAGGEMAVTQSGVMPGLSTIAFQIQIGEAFGYDFLNGALPSLSYTTAADTFDLADSLFDSALTSQIDNGTFTAPTGEEKVYVNTYGMQWDLSGTDTSSWASFDISWDGVQHAQIYGLRLDQGTGDHQLGSLFTAVPEPSAASLAALAVFGLISRRRR